MIWVRLHAYVVATLTLAVFICWPAHAQQGEDEKAVAVVTLPPIEVLAVPLGATCDSAQQRRPGL